MNETNNQERNELAIRILAIVGFVLLVIVLAWLAIQVVRFVPVAFSSLANIFEANQRDLHDRTDGDENVVVVVEDETPEDEQEEEVEEEEVTETPVVEVPDNKPVATSTPSTPSTPAKPAPVQYKTVVTYVTPVSDPKGYTDLQVAFVAVGKVNSSGRFVASDSVEEDEQNALQFTVKNIGTKTSAEWGFVAELPNNGEMSSKVQKPLKPSETSTLTLVFGMDDSNNKDRYAEVTVTGGSDTSSANNSFRTKVRVK